MQWLNLSLYLYVWMEQRSSGVLINVPLLPLRFIGLTAYRKHSQLLV